MGLIKNFEELAKTDDRKKLLEIIEAGLNAIQPEVALKNNVKVAGSTLSITDKTFTLDEYNRIFLIGFGKGSAGNAAYVENLLGDKLTDGFVIDTNGADFKKIKFTEGTHPLPSEQNYNFTNNLLETLKDVNLTDKDLVLVVICGGGSAMLVHPQDITLDQKISVNKALLKSGANITEMNVVRKHLSSVKGGGLAKALYPATVATLIFSDVPGNDLSVIASGPTVKDPTTLENAKEVIQKFNLGEELSFAVEKLHETPKEDMYFEKVTNLLVLSNVSALSAMQEKAEEFKIPSRVYSDKFQGNAREAGKILYDETRKGELLLAGGETTVTVTGSGVGGRNQEVVLGALTTIGNQGIISSFATDGWDNSAHAGAIGDATTTQKASDLNLNIEEFLINNDSFNFFKKTGDGIKTDRLPSNVSDLMLVWKK